MERTVEEYLQLPYTRELIPEPEGGWFVRIKELPGCMSQGETPAEAMAMIADAMAGWLETALAHGQAIPEPRHDEDFSGKFVVRVPKSMHRRLAEAAQADGVSLNQWIVAALASALGAELPHKPQRTLNRLLADEDPTLWDWLSNEANQEQHAQLGRIIRDWAAENIYTAAEDDD